MIKRPLAPAPHCRRRSQRWSSVRRRDQAALHKDAASVWALRRSPCDMFIDLTADDRTARRPRGSYCHLCAQSNRSFNIAEDVAIGRTAAGAEASLGGSAAGIEAADCLNLNTPSGQNLGTPYKRNSSWL